MPKRRKSPLEADKSTDPTPLAQRLRAARLAAGIENASDFARRVQVTPQTIYRIESGKAEPKLVTLRRWSLASGRSADDFLEALDDASGAAA